MGEQAPDALFLLFLDRLVSSVFGFSAQRFYSIEMTQSALLQKRTPLRRNWMGDMPFPVQPIDRADA